MAQQQNRVCCICKVKGKANLFMKLSWNRNNILKLLCKNIKSVNQWAHQSCISNLGLLDAPYSKGRAKQRVFYAAFEAHLEGMVRDIFYKSIAERVDCVTEDTKSMERDVFMAVSKQIYIAQPTFYAVKALKQLVHKVLHDGKFRIDVQREPKDKDPIDVSVDEAQETQPRKRRLRSILSCAASFIYSFFPNRPAAKVTKERKLKRRRKNILDNCTDLVAAVIGDTPKSPEETKRVYDLLHDQFFEVLSKDAHWCILWPKKTRHIVDVAPKLLTYIDTVNDPIIPELRDWVAQRTAGDESMEMPSYPAQRIADLRPLVEVPTDLQLIDCNIVMQIFERHSYFKSYLKKLKEITIDSSLIFNHLPPQQESIRQWKRITSDAEWILFSDIVACLDWKEVNGEMMNMQALTDWLLLQRSPPIPRSAWLKKERLNTWHVGTCLVEMRRAAIFLENLKVRGIDMKWIYQEMKRKKLLQIPA